MNIKYKVSDKLELSVDCKGIKDAFAFLGACDGVLGVSSCGNCGSDHLKFQHRKPKGYDYYSIVCNDCRHELKFGQQKETGALFPKGWEEPYQDQGDSNEPAAASSGGDDDVPWAA